MGIAHLIWVEVFLLSRFLAAPKPRLLLSPFGWVDFSAEPWETAPGPCLEKRQSWCIMLLQLNPTWALTFAHGALCWVSCRVLYTVGPGLWSAYGGALSSKMVWYVHRGGWRQDGACLKYPAPERRWLAAVSPGYSPSLVQCAMFKSPGY